MKDRRIWLSFDLGVSGDYEALYAWLDERGAIECADNVAFFHFRYDGADLVRALRKSLESAVNFGKRGRAYVVFKTTDGGVVGKWVIGGRHRAPWAGFAPSSEQDEEDVS